MSKKMSEGEEFLGHFFKSNEIKYRFENEKDILKLKGDTKSYRKPDFYLPRYDLYIEFNGRWNVSKEERERYREKMRIYRENEIPCVYLYPENLGIIEYLFDMRIRKELSKRPKSKSALQKYKWDCLLKDRKDLFYWIAISIIMIILGLFDSQKDYFIEYIVLFLFVIAYQLYRLIEGYRKFISP